MTKLWQPLRPGDCIQLVTPSSKIPDLPENLPKVISFLQAWGLTVKVTEWLIGEETKFPNLANTDEQRLQDLYEALVNPEVNAVCCIRGGYGAIRLIRQLQKLPMPAMVTAKIFMGFSDATLLLLYLRQQWGWNVLHAPTPLQAVMGKIENDDIEQLRQLLFAEIGEVIIKDLIPLNQTATETYIIKSEATGGNLTLLSRTLGWKLIKPLQVKDKILIIEDINESFRKVDGILQQMELAGYFVENNLPAAVIIGDFTTNESQSEQSQIDNALQEFADRLKSRGIPALRCLGIGHQRVNHPFPIGPKAILSLGNSTPVLTIQSGAFTS